MKKIALALIALSVIASAQYEVFVTKTGSGGKGKKTTVYFGEYKNFVKSSNEIKKYVAANGIQGALNGLSGANQAIAKGLLTNGASAGLTGAGIGIIVGILDPFVMELWADTTYYKITRRTSGKKVSYTKVLLVSDKSMSATQAKQILKKY